MSCEFLRALERKWEHLTISQTNLMEKSALHMLIWKTKEKWKTSPLAPHDTCWAQLPLFFYSSEQYSLSWVLIGQIFCPRISIIKQNHLFTGQCFRTTSQIWGLLKSLSVLSVTQEKCAIAETSLYHQKTVTIAPTLIDPRGKTQVASAGGGQNRLQSKSGQEHNFSPDRSGSKVHGLSAI